MDKNQCPWEVYRHRRRIKPVDYNADDQCYHISRAADVKRCLLSNDMTVEHPFRSSRQIFGKTILDSDGASHTEMRKKLLPFFSNTKVRSYTTSFIERIVDQVMTKALAKEKFDFMDEVADDIPVLVLMKVLGVQCRHYKSLTEKLDAIVRFIGGESKSLESAIANRDSIVEMLSESCFDEPEDTISGVLFRSVESGQCTRQELFDTLILLLAAGTATTKFALGNTMLCLLKNKYMLSQLDYTDQLYENIAKESLRYAPPLHTVVRFSRTDFTIHDESIPKGRAIGMSLASANMDESIYDRPGEWRLDRPLGSSATFGFGRHSCLGASLAVAEIRCFIRRTLTVLHQLECVSDSQQVHIVGNIFRRPRSLVIKYTRD